MTTSIPVPASKGTQRLESLQRQSSRRASAVKELQTSEMSFQQRLQRGSQQLTKADLKRQLSRISRQERQQKLESVLSIGPSMLRLVVRYRLLIILSIAAGGFTAFGYAVGSFNTTRALSLAAEGNSQTATLVQRH